MELLLVVEEWHPIITARMRPIFNTLVVNLGLRCHGLLTLLTSLIIALLLLLLLFLLFYFLLFDFFFLLVFKVILHFLDNVAFPVTFVVNAFFGVQEGSLVVGVQHILKQQLPLLQIPILHNLVRLIA